MDNSNFSYFETVLIRNEISNRSLRDIASILNKPVEEISVFAKELAKSEGIILFGSNIPNKIIKPAKVKKSNQAIITSRNIEKSQEQQRRFNNSPQYKTRVIDYTKLVCIRVTDKASIYVPIGSSKQFIETEKKKCIDKLNKPKEEYMPRKKPAKQVNEGHFGDLKKKRDLITY